MANDSGDELHNRHSSRISISSTNSNGLFLELEDNPFRQGKADQEQLDNILDKIGMGKFQYLLFLLCGFGWMSDNVSLISYITIYSITNLILIDVATSKISSTYIISLYLYKQNFYFILTIGSYRYFTPNSEYLLLYYFIYLYLQYYF
jgi:hypothetical protein